MKITQITSDFYHVPLDTPLSDSIHGEMPYFEMITVRILTDQGIEGMGYTYTVGHGGAAVYALLQHELAQVLVGQDPERTEFLSKRMNQSCNWIQGGALTLAISAVDIALWDIKGKAANLPLYRLLGGHSQSIPCYAGGVDLEFTLEALKAQADTFLSQGFKAIKMKVGRKNWMEDVERVAAMREYLGRDFALMIDANTGYPINVAVQAAREFSRFNLVWFEEPTLHTDYEGHRRIQEEGGIPVATGENMKSLSEFREMITRGGMTFPQPDITNMGGITAWIKVAHLAEAYNLPVSTHGVHDIQVHLQCAVANGSYLEMHLFAIDDYVEHPFQLENGNAVPPERPGHGVQLQFEKLEPHRVRL